jgi:hypothetical protein
MIVSRFRDSRSCDSDRNSSEGDENEKNNEEGVEGSIYNINLNKSYSFDFNEWLRAVISCVRCSLMTAVLVSKYSHSHSNPVTHTTKKESTDKLLPSSCDCGINSNSSNINIDRNTSNTYQTMNGNSEEEQEEHINALKGLDYTLHAQTHTHTCTHKEQKSSSDCLGNCAALDESNFSIGSLFYGRVDCVYEDSYDISTGACTGVSTGAYGGNNGNNFLQMGNSESSTLHGDHDSDSNNDNKTVNENEMNECRRRIIQRPHSFTITDRHDTISGNLTQGTSIASQSATNVHTSISTNSSTYNSNKKRLKLPSIPVPVVKSQQIQNRNNKKVIFDHTPSLPSPLSMKSESPNSSSYSTATSTPTSTSKILGKKKSSFSNADTSRSKTKKNESISKSIENIRNGKKYVCVSV